MEQHTVIVHCCESKGIAEWYIARPAEEDIARFENAVAVYLGVFAGKNVAGETA